MSSSSAPTSTPPTGPIPPPDLSKPINLLPLLRPPSHAPHASQPPLSQLPLGKPTPPRLPFRSSNPTSIAKSSNAPFDLSQISDQEWVATTHLYPAAYPRSTPNSTTPLAPSPSLHDHIVPPPAGVTDVAALKAHDRKQRQIDLARFDDIHARLPSLERLYPPHSAEEARKRAEDIVAEGKAPQLWGCVQRWRRKGSGPVGRKGQGLTLVYAHANGFHKEIYEPTIQALLEGLKGSKDTWVEEVWNLDSFNSGEAGILNRASLGEEVAWTDAPRDILQLLQHYLPSPCSPLDLPAILPRRDDDDKRGGREGRRFVGVGHSFSGAAMSLLATCEPDLFEGLFILDPVMGMPMDEWVEPFPSQVPIARSAVARQSYWPSRLSASTYLSSRPFFNVWHPSVLALHVQFGFRPLSLNDGASPSPPPPPPSSTSSSTPSSVEGKKGERASESDLEGPCTLSTTKWSEALAFASSWMGRFALQNVRLSGASYTGRVHIVTMKETTVYGPREDGFGERVREIFVRRMGENGKRGSGEELEGGHLVAQEQPLSLGRLMTRKLKEWFDGDGDGETKGEAEERKRSRL